MEKKQAQKKKVANAEGFIAALDQSGGSTPKALNLYGIETDSWIDEAEMFNLVHQMRSRIIESPSFSGDKILGAILFEQTMERKIGDLHTADFLWEKKKIVPFLICLYKSNHLKYQIYLGTLIVLGLNLYLILDFLDII